MKQSLQLNFMAIISMTKCTMYILNVSEVRARESVCMHRKLYIYIKIYVYVHSPVEAIEPVLLTHS